MNHSIRIVMPCDKEFTAILKNEKNNNRRLRHKLT
jgi:hypothetical protein